MVAVQEKAGEDASAVEPQQIQYTSLSAALQTDWALLDHRRSHKMICILQGEVCVCNPVSVTCPLKFECTLLFWLFLFVERSNCCHARKC